MPPKIPGPKAYPLIGCSSYIIQNGGPQRMVPVLKKLYKDFGNIVQLSAAGQKSIILFDPEDYMQIHKKGVNPEGATDAIWMLHEYFRKKRKGVKAMDFGTENWMEVRNEMQNGFFGIKDAAEFEDRLSLVAHDASQLIPYASVDTHTFLRRVSFEMICSVLLGMRMDALEHGDKLLNATVRSMECASGMLMGPLQKWNKTFRTKLWRDWVRSVDLMLKKTDEYVSSTELWRDDGMTTPYIKTLFERGTLSREEIIANVPGLMIDGFETVAATLHWTFLHLALNAQCQERLHFEIKTVLGNRTFQRKNLKEMPYLQSVMRETHRLTPTAFSFVRRVAEPLELDNGITLPANDWITFSPVGFSTDPKLVKEPYDFWPERFMDKHDDGPPIFINGDREWEPFDHPLMRDSFGFEAQKCLGARIAQMELWIAVTTIVRDHVIRVDGSQKFGIGNDASTFPDPAPKLTFTPRKFTYGDRSPFSAYHHLSELHNQRRMTGRMN